jgi:hypothetical protein
MGDELPHHGPEPVRAADDDAPLYRAERARLRDDTQPPYRMAQPPPPAPPEEPRPYRPASAAAGPPPAAAPPAPEAGERVTQAGLPRRVPRANMAPGMVASQQPDDQPPPGQPAARSPDEVRSMLSSYRTGIERGRTVAGGSDRGERPPDTP